MTAALEGRWVVTSTPRLYFAPGKVMVPILQDAGWNPGPDWKGAKSRPHRDSIVDSPAYFQPLYWLIYRAQNNFLIAFQFYNTTVYSLKGRKGNIIPMKQGVDVCSSQNPVTMSEKSKFSKFQLLKERYCLKYTAFQKQQFVHQLT